MDCHYSLVKLECFFLVQEETCQAMVRARSELLDILSAVEFLDRESMDIVTQHMPGARDPFVAVGGAPFYMLVETHGTNEEHDAAKLQSLLESLMVDELVVDATLAQSEQQAQALWLLREGVATALTKAGAVYKYDVSVPVRSMYGMVEDMRARLAEHSPGRLRICKCYLSPIFLSSTHARTHTQRRVVSSDMGIWATATCI